MTIFAVVNPLNPSSGLRETIRISSSGRRSDNVFEGQKYWPAMRKAPTTSLRLFDGDFSSTIQTGSASFDISLKALLDEYPGIENHRWAGTSVTLTHVDENGNGEPIFVGNVTRFGEKNGLLAITAEVDDEPFRADVLSSEYAGTGGIEGGADNKGNPKPLIFGRAKNVQPVQINVVDNIFQVSSYGPISQISAVYERGAAFGASIGDYDDFDALIAAEIPEGRWATCLALGLFRLGAPPYGLITADVDGLVRSLVWLRRTGAIIKAVAEMSGASLSQIDSESLDALDVAVPYDVNIVISGQIDVLTLAQRMALPCNAQAGIDLLGRIFVTRVVLGSPSLILNGAGKNLPAVIDIAESSVRPPYKRIVFGAERSWRVHSFDEIAFQAELIERGRYSTTTVYREGNIVDLEDGSRWIFVGETPTANSYPTSINANWDLLSGETEIHAIGGNRITHASEDDPYFPEFAVNGTGDRHVDLEGRRYVQLSYDDAQLVIDGIPITIDGQPVYMGWRRIDPVVKIGGVGGLIVQNSSGDNQVDSDLLNNLRRQVVATAEIQLQADTEGALQSTIPFDIQVKALIGNDDVSAETSFAATFPPGITGTINNDSGDADRGDINISALVSGGNIVVTATFADGLKESVQIRVTVVTGQQPITGGTGATMIEDRTWLNISSTDFVQITDQPLVLNSDGSGDLRFSFSASFEGVAGLNVEVVARYRTEGSGGAWSDAGTSAVGSATAYEPEFGITLPGYISKAQFTQAMGANDSPYEVALFGKRIAGSGSAAFSNSNSLFLVKQ